MAFRTLTQLAASLMNRGIFGRDGITFGGRRNMYEVLGYKRQILVPDYRGRYRRNEVANRIVKALPKATWRGGAEIAEDKETESDTNFEKDFRDLDNRLKVWDVLRRADILSGIGRFAIILITAPGAMDEPLESCSLADIALLTPYAEGDATIQLYDTDEHSARYGLPEYYMLKRGVNPDGNTALNNVAGIGKRVHWTRCIHIADGLLDDSIFGEPRLQCVWNRLDDLEKVAGGGAEAFWKRADQGKQFDLDPTMDLSEAQITEMQNQIDAFNHEGKRTLRTRGMTINEFGSDVADFKSPVEAIISLISAGTGIPQRVLMGSEQGKLAAKQDKASWDNQVIDRQKDYAGPMIVRPFVDRLVTLGALTPPAKGYTVTWSTIQTMDDEQRATIGKDWVASQSVTRNELRTRVLGLPELPENDPRGSEILGMTAPTPPEGSGPGGTRAAWMRGAVSEDDPMVVVLEAALSHGQMGVVEHLLGMKVSSEPTAVAQVTREIHTIEKIHPDLAEALKTLASREQLPASTEVHNHFTMPEQQAPVTNVTFQAPAPADVRVEAPVVNVQPANVQVHVDAPPAPEVHIARSEAPIVNVQPPVVNVAAPVVHVETPKPRRVVKKVHRDSNNMITSFETEE